ncbi:MAG: toll/interleukin-1 receptor domain-containing protein [Fibromonadaceae bacterium]|jgi:hypothetical protein|nr:toll/interleukin-1 receptor domain-containing protein [Fibromonadaceae bacterium]
MSKKFEIFISYRRKGGYDTAKLLYDRLRIDGYSVSFDIDTLEKGDFDNELEQRVYDCKDFLLVLNPGVFDRFFDPECDPKDDWVRQEIKCALEKNKNIVPLILDGFTYPKNLPEDVKNITKKNAIDLNPKHFEGAYAGMKQKFLLSKPRWAKRNKKLIIAFISLLILGIAAGITSLLLAISEQNKQKDLQLEAERVAAARYADSIKTAMQQTDSLRKAELDSIKNVQTAAQKASAQKTAGPSTAKEKPAQKSSSKSIYWSGPNDVIGQVVYGKLASTGIQKANCSGNGIVAKLNKPNCRTNDLGKIICTYSPKLAITYCDGTHYINLEINEKFKSSPQTDENAAKEEIANELREFNFSGLVKELKELK